MSFKHLTIALCGILLLATTSQVLAAPPLKRAEQQGPIRGVANDLWADIVIGKPDFGQMSPYEVTGNRVFNPGGVIVDRSVTPNRMYVYDGGNNRVLGLHVTTHAGDRAELVLGQPGLDGYAACNHDSNFQHYPLRAAASAATLCTIPESQISIREGGSFANMAVDAQGNLYVPDFDNHRVLLYKSPFETDTIADDLWGQANFAGNECNRNNPMHPTASSLCLRSYSDHGFVGGVGLDSANNLWVADNNNNRVLRFPYDAATGHASHTANLVLGQANFALYEHGTTMQQMWGPAAVRVGPTGSVYVADSLNNRILIFNPPFSNGMTASSTLGANLRKPTSIEFDQNNNIWVSDSGNNQLLRFTPTKVIDRVLLKDVPNYKGECGGDYGGDGPDFYFPGPNVYENSIIACDSRGSIGIDSDGNVWITASDNWQDVLRFPAPLPPIKQGTAHSADMRAFQAYAPTQSNAVTGRGLSDPRGITLRAGQLIVSDGGRLLFWNNAPTSLTNGKPADGVVGAPNFNMTAYPPIGQIQADEQDRLWVLSNNTISVYHLPLVTGATPFYTLIPPLAVRGELTWNPNLDIAGMIVAKDGEQLWLSDPDNHRVIRIANPLTDPVVDVVLGQLDATQNQCNQGKAQPTASSLCYPGSIAMDKNGNIFVADFSLEIRGNQRLLEYNANHFPKNPTKAIFGVPANRVYGTEGNFNIKACNKSPTTDPLCNPFEPVFDHAGQMVVGLSGYAGQHFPLVYQNPLTNPLPVATLKDYYSMPSAAYYDDNDNLYVADRNRGRVLIYLANRKTILGNAGTPGAILNYTDGRARSVIADENGDYTIKVSTGWSGTITPSLQAGWAFTPSHIDYTNVSSDQTAQNYSAKRYAYFISGNIPFAGIQLSYEDGGPKSTTTDAKGNYTLMVSPGWSGNVTPSGLGAKFTPPNRAYLNISKDLSQQNYTFVPLSLTFRSIAAQDGWLLESNETSSQAGTKNTTDTTLRVGDDAQQRQYRSILSFNTSGLPDNATIMNITLKLKLNRVVGNKNLIGTFGLMVGIYPTWYGVEPSLELGDFGLVTIKHYGPFTPSLVNGFYNIDLTQGNQSINRLTTSKGLTQIGLYFKVDDNDDNIADYLRLFSGSAPTVTDRPQLIITYYLPTKKPTPLTLP